MSSSSPSTSAPASLGATPLQQQGTHWRMRYMLFIAGMGGLLYGIDIGIIAGALPYLESTASVLWKLSAQQLGFIVAAVLLGSVLSSLFAGALADWIGRRQVLILSGALFTLSIPCIALAEGYTPLLLGRLLQGISGGLIGVVVPLYLAECLGADNRGRGTAMFQLLLTIGLVLAALIGLHYARQVEAVSLSAQALGDGGEALFAAKDLAWRSIFWICLVPGLVFTAGCLALGESPRWLFSRGRKFEALATLQRSRSAEQAQAEWQEMQALAADANTDSGKGSASDSLLSRRYLAPFFLACVILACTQATGINSILAYLVTILHQAGLPGSSANAADVAVKLLNALMTVVAVVLVDRKGRKFLLMLGSGGICLSLLLSGILFWQAERGRQDIAPAVQGLVQGDSLSMKLDDAFLQAQGLSSQGQAQQLTLAYSFGDFSNVQTRRSDDLDLKSLQIARADTVQADSVIGAFFRRLHLNPFADPASAATAPLKIEQAWIGPVPSESHGWLVTACIFAFVAFFAVGPGVCVWLALSELMPTRIRSNGMSIALLINQFVSTTIAAVFLPTVGHHGYAAMFFFWAGCTVVYFLTASFLLPETKGRTLEEIEAFFARKSKSRSK